MRNDEVWVEVTEVIGEDGFTTDFLIPKNDFKDFCIHRCGDFCPRITSMTDRREMARCAEVDAKICFDFGHLAVRSLRAEVLIRKQRRSHVGRLARG